MPLIQPEVVKYHATVELHNEAFKKAVEEEKLRLKERKKHFLPWKIKFRSPIELIEHHKYKHWKK